MYSEIVIGLSGMLLDHLTWQHLQEVSYKVPSAWLYHLECFLPGMAAFAGSFLQNALWLGHLECFSPDMAAFVESFLQNATWLGHLEWNASVTWRGSICRKFPTKCLVIVPSGMLLTWHGSICRKFPTKCLVIV